MWMDWSGNWTKDESKDTNHANIFLGLFFGAFCLLCGEIAIVVKVGDSGEVGVVQRE